MRILFSATSVKIQSCDETKSQLRQDLPTSVSDLARVYYHRCEVSRK